MKQTFLTRGIGLMVGAALVALLSVVGVAQERTGRFQRTVDFATPKTLNMAAAVGPVKITTLEFADLGRGYSAGGFGARMRPGGDSEASTTVRTRLTVDNPTNDEWELTLTLELLDKSGKVVDKLTKKKDYDDETDVWTIEHPLLEYVMPLVSEVRITVQGRVK